jgi:hypothetical protein
MKATEFKAGLKEISSQLKGLTLQLVAGNNATPFKSLNQFGNAILSEEKARNDFTINQAWTVNGVVSVSTFTELKALFNTVKVTAVSFKSLYAPVDFADYLRTSFGTND